jgi:tetratricopeptide (TPR) repeat protein
VTESRKNRWIINTILILSLLAFIGFSILPILAGMMSGNQNPTANNPTPLQSAAALPQKQELESQVKGYELVLQREPENQTALKGLLEARLNMVRFGYSEVKDVIPPLEKLAKLNPTQTDYAVLLAQAKQQTGDREGAVQTYREILKTQPGNLNALDGMVTLLLQEQRPEAAIDLLQNTLKEAPAANQAQAGSIDVPSLQLLLGRVYAEQKRFDEALAAYDEAAKANQEDFRPILAKALVLKAQNKTEAAKPLFTKAAELAPAQYKDQINQLAAAPAPGAASPTATPPAGTATPAPNVVPVPTPAPTATPAPSLAQ